MPLGPDDEICYCFHVSLRKVENYCVREKPKAASQISACLSAGTGCGWCRPMLRKIHTRLCGAYKPWWQEAEVADDFTSAEREATDAGIDADAYAKGRQSYLAATKRQPPGGDAPGI